MLEAHASQAQGAIIVGKPFTMGAASMLFAALVFALALAAGGAWAVDNAWAAGPAADAPGDSRLAASSTSVVPAAKDAAAPAIELKNGVYLIRCSAPAKQAIAVENASIHPNANVVLAKKRNRANAEKFRIVRVSNGYYRISAGLASTALTVQGGSKDVGANVLMRKYHGSAAQLWKPVETRYGIQFVNKRSGLALACTSRKAGANVLQADADASKLSSWRLVRTSVNMTDRGMFLSTLESAPYSNGVKLANRAAGYKVNAKKWQRLKRAVRTCRSSGINVSFVLVDAKTGMTVSSKPDNVFFGASTIKGLYVTYLVQSSVEKGTLSLGSISGLATQAVVHSNNGAYKALRARYGSQAGFAKWLRRAHVGSLSLWPNYSPRVLSKAWVNMLAYSHSRGAYVKFWRKTFSHSDMSVIHDALGGYRKTYSKPGWMYSGEFGTVLNDAGVVRDAKGGRYVLSIMSNAYPGGGSKAKVQRVVKALDAVHRDMARAI